MTLKFRNLKFGALTYQNEAGPNIKIRCFDKACPGQECVILNASRVILLHQSSHTNDRCFITISELQQRVTSQSPFSHSRLHNIMNTNRSTTQFSTNVVLKCFVTTLTLIHCQARYLVVDLDTDNKARTIVVSIITL